MLFDISKLGWAAGAGIFMALVAANVQSQTLPVAGNPREAVEQDRAQRAALQERDAIRGVREQDEAAQRAADRLNRDARQEARQQAIQSTHPAAQAAAIAAAELRAADLGIWFSGRPGPDGLVVMDITDRGALAQAGLREGDRIVSINGHLVTSEGQFVQTVTQPSVGTQAINIGVIRGNQQQTVIVQPAALTSGIASFDPLYQVGLILNDRIPDRLVVARVFPRTPAYYAGIRAGDVLTSVNGTPLLSMDGLTQALQSAGGNVLNLQVDRLGQTRQLNLGAGEGLIRSALRPTLNANAEVTGGQQSGVVTQNGVSGRVDTPRTSAGTGSTLPQRSAERAARGTGRTTVGGVTGAGGSAGSALTNPEGAATRAGAGGAAAAGANIGIPPQNLPQGSQLVNPNLANPAQGTQLVNPSPTSPAQGTIIANPSVVPGAAPLGTVPGTQGTNPVAPGGTTPAASAPSAPIGTSPGTGTSGTGTGGTGTGGTGGTGGGTGGGGTGGGAGGSGT